MHLKVGKIDMITKNDEILKKIADLVSNKDFVYDIKTKKWHTYHDVWSKSYAIAENLSICGHKTVIAVMNNGFDLFALYFACMIAGVVIVPIDPQKSRKEIECIVEECDDYILLEDDADIFSNGVVNISIDDIKKAINEIDLNKVFMVTYTSGSTGHAKGVIHNLKNLFLAAETFGGTTGLNENYTMCHVMPMTYMAGILNTIIMPFFCGAKIVLLPRFDVMSALKFWTSVEKLGVTAFWLSPTMLNLLTTIDKKGQVKSYLSQKETLFFVGTAPLFEKTRKKFEERYGVKLLQSYGLSETLFISTEKLKTENNIKSVGTILPQVKINLGSGNEIEIDVPWMFLGYSNENTLNYFVAGRYKSGDMGKIDEKNRLYITGRIKDLIVKGGMNISPTQIEKCLSGYEAIVECVVAGVTLNDEENIVCWYVLKPGMELSYNEINHLLEEELGRNSQIDLFRQIASIPKNLNGKVDKQKLVREFSYDN